jgi:hypothetical protein
MNAALLHLANRFEQHALNVEYRLFNKPMIEHIVLFRWTEAASEEAKNEIMAELRRLKGKIPGIIDLSCGTNFCDRSKGYTHGLVVRFTDRAALEAYGPHPEHQRVVQSFIAPIRADILAVDYEM